jgi:hypothetical protein
MKFRYNNLEVQVLNKKEDFGGDLQARIISFIANNFLIVSDNPRFIVMRKGKIYTPRDKRKFIFNFWSQALLTGAATSIGVPTPKKIKKEERKMGKRRIPMKRKEIREDAVNY